MEGHVRKRGTASWELRVYVGRDPITRRERYMTRTVKGSKRDAERALRTFLGEVDSGVIVEGTFGELLERWFEVASTARNWSPVSVAETRRTIDTKLRPIADIPLEKLRTQIIDSFYAQLRANGGACGHDPLVKHDG
ncbi:MAG: hypothetical protein ACRD6W_10510, partial [Nitrososphaerales archaeon]